LYFFELSELVSQPI